MTAYVGNNAESEKKHCKQKSDQILGGSYFEHKSVSVLRFCVKTIEY